jgi:iron complex outermembrane receptor protein
MLVSFGGCEMRPRGLKRCVALLCFAGLMGGAVRFAQAQQTKPPKPVHVVPAKYPDSAIRDGIDATVLVMLTIPSDGIPKDVKIAKGFRPDFDQSAIDSVRQWRFHPATKGGKPIEVTVTLQVAFRAPR